LRSGRKAAQHRGSPSPRTGIPEAGEGKSVRIQATSSYPRPIHPRVSPNGKLSNSLAIGLTFCAFRSPQEQCQQQNYCEYHEAEERSGRNVPRYLPDAILSGSLGIEHGLPKVFEASLRIQILPPELEYQKENPHPARLAAGALTNRDAWRNDCITARSSCFRTDTAFPPPRFKQATEFRSIPRRWG
jgi:hypothetical protein